MEHVAVRAYCMFEGFSANYCSIIVASKSHGEAFGPHKKSRASDLALALKLVRSMGLEPIRSPIRPSNVRVCLFRHDRELHELLYLCQVGMSSPCRLFSRCFLKKPLCSSCLRETIIILSTQPSSIRKACYYGVSHRSFRFRFTGFPARELCKKAAGLFQSLAGLFKPGPRIGKSSGVGLVWRNGPSRSMSSLRPCHGPYLRPGAGRRLAFPVL